MAMQELYDRFRDEDRDEMMKNYMHMIQAEEERQRAMQQLNVQELAGGQINGNDSIPIEH